MVKLPEVLGLIPCEEFHVDPHAGRMSLIGIFLSLRFSDFPARMHEFTVYAALFDARGEGEMRLTCTRLETEEDLLYNSRWCSYPTPGRITQLTLPLRGVVFPAPGRYSITLAFDKQSRFVILTFCEGKMREPKIPVRLDEFNDLLVIDDGEEWNAVTEAFNRHFPDRAGKPFDLANYTQAEIDAVMVEFEPKKPAACAAVAPTNSD